VCLLAGRYPKERISKSVRYKTSRPVGIIMFSSLYCGLTETDRQTDRQTDGQTHRADRIDGFMNK
jgi:hypothetical protein